MPPKLRARKPKTEEACAHTFGVGEKKKSKPKRKKVAAERDDDDGDGDVTKSAKKSKTVKVLSLNAPTAAKHKKEEEGGDIGHGSDKEKSGVGEGGGERGGGGAGGERVVAKEGKDELRCDEPRPKQWKSNVCIKLRHMANNYYDIGSTDSKGTDKPYISLNAAYLHDNKPDTDLQKKFWWRSPPTEAGTESPAFKLNRHWNNQERGPTALLHDLVSARKFTVGDALIVIDLALEEASTRWNVQDGNPTSEDSKWRLNIRREELSLANSFYLTYS
jgi:hypothetical protein